MSVVTALYIQTSMHESDWEKKGVIKFEETLGIRLSGMTQLDDMFGGPKYPQCHAWGAGLNWFDEKEAFDYLMAVEWEYPENVVVIMQPEEGSTYVWRPGEPNPTTAPSYEED